MFDDPPSQASKQGPVAGQILSANPVSEPSDFFPPTPPVPVKNHSTAKIAGAVFGLMFLVGGLAAGVTLLMQPQLLNQKAQTVSYLGTCTIMQTCNTYGTNGSVTSYCDPSGKIIAVGPYPNGVCSFGEFSRKCTSCSSGNCYQECVSLAGTAPQNQCFDGAWSDCKNAPVSTCPSTECQPIPGLLSGASACMSTEAPNTVVYCCPKGQYDVNGKCTTLQVCDPTAKCDKYGAYGATTRCTKDGGLTATYCCNPGEVIAESQCIKPCTNNACTGYRDTVTGTTACGNTKGQIKFCCPDGQKIVGTSCVKK